MKSDLTIGVAILAVTGIVAGAEMGLVQGQAAALLLAAGAVTALIFSMMRKPEIDLRNYKGQDVLADPADELELKGPLGSGAKMTGRNLPERLLGDRTVILILVCAVAWFMWYHHTESADLLRKNTEAIVENTFVASLSQEKKEALNLAMPESLRRKLRRIEP